MAVRVPYEPYPTAQPTAPGTPSVGVTTPGAAFGVNVGQAIGRLGEQLGAGGNELFRAAMQVQNISNETEARNGGIAFTGAAGNLLTDFQTKEGMNSKNALPKFNKDLNDLWQKSRGTLSTDAARRQFDSEYGRELNYMLLGASRHAGIEIKKARDNANAAAIQSNLKTTQLDPTNDPGFQQRLDHTLQLTRDYWAGKGALKEQVDEEIRKNTEDMYRNKILGLIKEDPDRALRELEAARQQHVPGRLDIFGDQEEYDNLENKILKEMGVVTGRNIARDVVKEAVDKEQTEQQAVDAALKQAGEKSKNPIFLNAVEDQTRNRFSSAHTALHNARSEQVTKGLDELAKLENTIKTDKDGKPIVPSNIFDDASRIEDKYGLHEVTNKAQELQRTARQLQLPEPLARESNLAAMDLFRRMNLPTDDPNKITSLSQVRDVYAPPDGSPGKLTRADEEWLEKRFIEAGTPDGERLSKIRAQFSKAVEPMIDKSNPLLGKIDQSGKLQNYAFERFVDQKMDEYRKAGKNPSDLLDPSKPDYLGSPEVLKPYLIPLQESLRTMTERLTGASARGIAPPSPQPTVPQRKPGESMADFDKRIGIK